MAVAVSGHVTVPDTFHAASTLTRGRGLMSQLRHRGCPHDHHWRPCVVLPA